MPTLWPIEDGRDCAVPSVVRSAVVPLLGARPALGVPPFFDAMDPADIDAFTWDWSAVAFPGDLITAAAITCSPPVMVVGTIIIYGQTVQAILGPVSTGRQTVDLNCAVTFASGRVLDWGVELSVSTT